jgi:periplasmic protein TonB
MKSSLVSATIHLAIVAVVVLFTPGIGSTRQRPPERPTIVIYRPPAPTHDQSGPVRGGHGGLVTREPTIQVPPTVPPNIPPVGTPNAAASTITLDTTWEHGPRSTHTDGTRSGQSSPTGVLAADVVDVQVAPYPGAPTPRYPETLREAGVEGEVVLEFVVDTAGRVEAGSIRKISSTADAFVVSVGDALTATRYHPALVGGRHVRQLVRQEFVFSLTPH